MKQLIVYLSIALLLVSCYNFNKPKKPESLISKEKMAHVIIDMSLLSSAKGINKVKVEKSGLHPKDYVYKKHNIDSIQFALSNEYYAFNIDDYDAIYSKVKDSLEKLKKKYKKIVDDEQEKKRKRDSLKRKKRKDSIRKFKKLKTKAPSKTAVIH